MRSFGVPKALADGSLRYKKRGWEPPPPLEGYERDPADPWLFRPAWLPCIHRKQDRCRKSCGALAIIHICQHPDIDKSVSFKECNACGIRKAPS